MKNIRPTRAPEERPQVSPLALALHILLIYVAFVALLLVNFWPDKISLEEGQISPKSIMAERKVEIVNEKATDEARRRAAVGVGELYTFDPDAVSMGETRIENTFLLLDKARPADGKSLTTEELTQLSSELPIPLSNQDINTLLSLDDDDRFLLQNGARHILYRLMDNAITEAKLDEIKGQTADVVKEQLKTADPATQATLVRLINEAIQVNQLYSPEKTRRAEQQAMAGVPPVMTTVPKGAAVVRQGEIVTKDDIRVLEELGLYKPRLELTRVLGVCLLVAAGLAVIFGYMIKDRYDLLVSRRYLAVLGIIMVATATISRLLLEVSIYLTPIAIASVLITTLMDRRLGLLVTGVLALFVGVMANSLPVMGVAFMTGAVGVMALTRVDSRASLIYATLLVGLSNFIAVLAFELLEVQRFSGVLEGAGFGLLNGFLSGWVAVGALPMFEQFSGITTHFRLLDLSHMNEPLLRRLTLEAPGTYQHSMMVANLAEQAARAIGADALLCRVGAYYHDIGKMKRPRFFIENQMGLENPHDKLAPSLSTRIIHSHVKDGIEMARAAKLPDVLIDFIAQHHGTSLVGYFYHQACARSAEPVFEEDFRYPGPKPQTRETAVLMLCDGLEAAARTLSAPTPEKLSELVNKMVKHNLDDGQLDESGLSLRDIKIVKDTLSKALQGIYHARIEYPEPAPPRRKVTQLRRKGS
jgi:putative nucleotidyltransferase with HDIG domain